MENAFDTSYLIPGTDAATTKWYAALPALGQESFELLEDEIVVVDTETTGLDPSRDQLIEIAACIMRGPKIVDRFQTFVDPGFHIPDEISELTGISDRDVCGKPDPSLAVELFAEWADDRDLVAHNASFDRGVIMRQALPGAIPGKWMDSLAMARIVLPRMRSHRLKDLACAFGLPQSTHRATDDVEATARLWRILVAGAYTLPDGLADLIASLSPITDWPLRHIFSQAALALPGTTKWTLRKSRSQHVMDSNMHAILDPEEERPAPKFPTDEQIAHEFSREGAAGRMYENYEPRREQLDMALEVVAALRTSTHRALEAGTGVGKSMAYLLPAAMSAKANDITFGVATKTNALMDQLVYNELPRLEKALGGLRYVALKGYDHYPCLRKLESMARETDARRKPEVIEMVATLHTYVAQTAWGDLDALNLHWWGLPRYAIEASSSDCLKNRCPYFPLRCYLHGARRQAKNSHIVVTNHALLFRNVKADNGILPTIKHWIVDEAHAVEAEARDQLSFEITARDLEAALIRLGGSHGTLAQISRKALELDGGVMLQGKCAQAQAMIGTIQNVATSFFSFVKDLSALSDDHGRGSYNRITLWISDEVRASSPWLTLENPGRSLSKKLEELVDCLQRLAAMVQQFEKLNNLYADLSHQHCSLWEMQSALSLVIEGKDKDYVYSAVINLGSDEVSEELNAARLDVGKALAEDFYPNASSVIYTSATLATGSSKPFAFFEHGSGLDLLDSTVVGARQMASSYDFDKHMKVLLPAGFPEPADRACKNQLAELIYETHVTMGGSVLTLFTNRREMEELYHSLKPRLAEQGIELIAQTRGFSTKTIRDRFLADRELCLFALKSFWEGFDAPGETLRCVIIPKLPFGRPNDPISRERELREGRAAWARYSLPEAVMDLKQAAGRLIRNSTDRGFLILADGRLQTKSYGKTFLKALPTSNIRTLPVEELLQVMREEQ